MKTFLSLNFGCRVNSAETNLFSQSLIDQGYIPSNDNPDIIFVNTCAITKKGEYESISKIKKLQLTYPQAKIIATGCADLSKLKSHPNTTIVDKENLPDFYTHKIKDKFSHTNRYLLKVQSGCTQNCSYCVVPSRRTKLWFLPLDKAVESVNQAVDDGYTEIIITGVNLNQYLPGFSNLIEALLQKTKINLISFGSIPINCIDDKFVDLLKTYSLRLSNFLHIPIQSGSDKILKLMNRNYDVQKITKVFNQLKTIPPLSSKRGLGGDLSFGTDIIVGFPTETDSDFQDTLNLCQSIGFSQIHVFRYSPRPNTPARELFLKSSKIAKETRKTRSKLISQTKVPSHQTPRI